MRFGNEGALESSFEGEGFLEIPQMNRTPAPTLDELGAPGAEDDALSGIEVRVGLPQVPAAFCFSGTDRGNTFRPLEITLFQRLPATAAPG